jgi:hypothetical protein
LRLDETPVFCQARVTALGSLDTKPDDAPMLGAEIVPWTHLQISDNVFAEVEVRGVLASTTAEIHWLSGDAEIEMLAEPRYADLPENLIPLAQPVQTPAGFAKDTGRGFTMDTPEGWPPLIWASSTLYSAVRGWTDPEGSVAIILCALTVAPDIGDLRPMLLAGLKARYAMVARLPDVYPPARYPWHTNDLRVLGQLKL